MILRYYTDPAHGWIAVKRTLLKKLKIEDKISVFSYQKGNTVYVEEDWDAHILSKALAENQIVVELVAKHTNNRSPIRNYAPYDNF